MDDVRVLAQQLVQLLVQKTVLTAAAGGTWTM